MQVITRKDFKQKLFDLYDHTFYYSFQNSSEVVNIEVYIELALRNGDSILIEPKHFIGKDLSSVSEIFTPIDQIDLDSLCNTVDEISIHYQFSKMRNPWNISHIQETDFIDIID